MPYNERQRNIYKRAIWSIVILALAYIMSTSNTETSQFKPAYPPPQWTHTPKQVLEVADELIASEKKINDHIASIELPTIELLEEIIQQENEVGEKENIVSFYKHVSADKELRDASSDAIRKLLENSIEESARVDVYRVIKKLYESTKKEDLDPETYRFLDKLYTNLKRLGLDLPDDKREEVTKLRVEIANLSNDFAKNLNEDNSFLVFTREELEGIPQDTIEQYEEVDGGLKVTFKYPDYFPLMKYAKNQDVRKRAYLAYANRPEVNAEILTKIAKLRYKVAKFLGYNNYADYVLENRLAKSQEKVMEFINDLRERLTPLAKEELKRLKAFKNEDLKARGLPPQDDYYGWDNAFYQNLLLEKEYQVDHKKISEYFPLDHTVEKMISFYEKIFDVKFVEVKNPDPSTVWHPDVKLFALYQNINHGTPKNKFMGWLYLDLHPRDGKYTHAANFNLIAGYTPKGGKRVTPVTALVCNFTKPTKTKPSLLKHDEVTTFFHELGHGIHNLLSETTHARFHGTAVPRDFVETPSQMLEFWTWSTNELKELTSHHETGESISDDLIQLLIRTKHVNTGLLNLRQLQFGFFDMWTHSVDNDEDIEKLDLTKLWNEASSNIALLTTGGIATRGYASFGHIAGGYESAYYGYLYSLVFANDLYHTLFREDPMNVTNGLKYRDAVLKPGNSREIMEGVKEVLGREPNAEAFMAEILGTN